MNRNKLIQTLLNEPQKQWDIIVIGGGATGLGIALDAVTRGFNTLLFEQSDFCKRNLIEEHQACPRRGTLYGTRRYSACY